ncbi:OprO/OprP family phosphate-selective porin [Adhaeretor mobilis]|uniref:Phosphate-selective porin O and P n=1 Tax=Adhaeretor mobilis TaxID=1930276 RepID=A0A517N0W4_9BACT|nr:OprO/OprP family phosphate-selective porin [Adhaeretor mobilis]QDT00779.1 Phosphate-selective porin O and P [Adhaeretor mobilis]
MLRVSNRIFSVLASTCLLLGAVCSQDVFANPTTAELKSLLDKQAAEISELRDQVERQASVYESASKDEPFCGVASTIRRLPVVVEDSCEPLCDAGSSPDFRTLRYYTDHDKGFVLRPFDSEKHPLELKVNGWIQFRHHAFSRDADSWTDNAGVTRPIRNRNAFDIERARLIFSGYAQDPRLTYFLQLDGDTDGGHTVDFFDYWWAWECSDRFLIQMGKRKVVASRQWLLGARRTRFIDRPMACDFFRPDRTIGLFGIGKIGNTGHYEIMAGNGYRTANLPNSTTDNRFAFASTNYFDPFGDFGGQIVDFECTSDPLVRFGHSFVYSSQAADAVGVPLDETDFIRLTDGTRLTQTGALTAGVAVSEFDIYFYGVDAAMKWRGWSVNTELFLRWIEDIRGDGALSVNDLFQRGFYVEGGRFIVPQRLDWNVRYSQVSGLFGERTEYAAGLNWYPLESPAVKVSFDVTALDGSPEQNTTSDILVGDSGVLFRTQFQAEF